MKLKLTWLMTLFMAFVMQLSFAQEKTITGTVTSSTDGLPLPGVNVIVKGTTRGTQTDFDGKYSIKASAAETLVFSFVGYKNTESSVGGNNTVNISLVEDLATLDEVVITGYATTTKPKTTSAITTITSKTIENRPNASFVQTLSGQVPGLNITTASGQPGAASNINLRGVATINGNTQPLFIIDGAPVDERNFRSLNPQDIATISVLKDAAATAIYGNRGANGVVVIKTRGGTLKSALKVNYTGTVGYSSQQDNDYDLMNAPQQLRLERAFGNGAGAGNSTSLFNPGNGQPMTDAQIDAVETTEWNKVFLRTSVNKTHNLSLTSGGENSSQFTSIGFSDIQGILLNSNLKRFNVRSNVSGKSNNEKFTYGTNLSINYSTSDEPGDIGTAGINRNLILGGYSGVPYLSPSMYTNGAALLSPLSFTNTPLFLLDLAKTGPRFDEEVKVFGSINGGYKITNDLSANVVMSADYTSEFFTRAEESDSFNALLFGGGANPFAGFQDQQSTRVFTYNQVTSLNYNKEIGKHTFDVGAYVEYFKAHLRTFGYRARGLNDQTFFPGDGAGFVGDVGTNDFFVDAANAQIRNAGLFSYFGSLDYDYDTKYGFSATVRRDASYRFGDTNRWATFWALSGRWNISNEAFMEGSAINVLKLRASYGTAGNQQIAGPGYFSGPDLSQSFFGTGVGYQAANAINVTQFGNNTLKWETVATANIGLDFEVWNSRLRGQLDAYQRETEELFQDTPVSAVNGITQLSANTGNLTNTGFDFSLNYDLFRSADANGFNMTVGVVGNYNKNELSNLPSPEGEIIGLGRDGGKLFEYFVLRYAGVNPANGELLYLTADGNVTESPNADTDRVWTGKNIFPDWNGSFNLNLDYKGFFLTTQWNYSFGSDRFDNDYAGFINPDNIGQFRHSNDINRAWQQPGDVTDIPAWRAANRNSFGSDRFLRNADFVRLRFASIGYRVPTQYLGTTGISNLTFFLNGENILTFTEWRGFDVEALTNTSRLYPTPRTFTVGFELGF